ncbi:ATP-dependent RNA helicase [Actinomortierella ambigua]|uniref:ATP-dependent RNA helicase n=1 Tax=Actinomortierella ambigua TaxID=1343610 RepID=A0A9P6UD90_9FUNG|nr:ATP-dependent RNA helicase [Actinomortierella ambigua]
MQEARSKAAAAAAAAAVAVMTNGGVVRSVGTGGGGTGGGAGGGGGGGGGGTAMASSGSSSSTSTSGTAKARSMHQRIGHTSQASLDHLIPPTFSSTAASAQQLRTPLSVSASASATTTATDASHFSPSFHLLPSIETNAHARNHKSDHAGYHPGSNNNGGGDDDFLAGRPSVHHERHPSYDPHLGSFPSSPSPALATQALKTPTTPMTPMTPRPRPNTYDPFSSTAYYSNNNYYYNNYYYDGSVQASPIDYDHLRHQTALLNAAAATAAKSKDAAQIFGLKAAPVSPWKKTAWILFTMGIFLLPYVILKACFHVQVSAGAWQTSVTYGMLMALDFMAVISFSALNRRRVNRRVRQRDPHWVGLSTGVLAVGYREDPILLEGCLKSLKAMRYQQNQRILLVVDGNEAQDEYMAQIFQKVFSRHNPAVIRPDFLCMDREPSSKDREDLVRQIAAHPGPVCVMQPHRGKRSAMYTGFCALLQQGIEAVVVTDSDTYLDPHVCKELAFALAESPIIGAATGDVRIYNTGTWVSFLSSLRYWFAFNLERGAQSYHSVVNCVSGPLGIYRMSIIADVMDQWVRQSFLGVMCTYGDDRHLTNLVLRDGYKVKFTHYAICYTDTPIRFIAWVTQQTRWSKSFFREIPIQLGCMHLHSPWMTYALLYQLIYPMMMIYNLVNCIYFGTGAQISWWLVSIAFVGLLKTSYALRVTGDKKFLFTTIYGFLYMMGYVPAKIFAALTLYDNSWGTSARLIRNFTRLQNYIAPVAWGLVLGLGIFHRPARYSQVSPIPIGGDEPFFTDRMIQGSLVGFIVCYLAVIYAMFIRNGVLKRDYKRDFSYEELYENMTSYISVEGGKRKVARFEV